MERQAGGKIDPSDRAREKRRKGSGVGLGDISGALAERAAFFVGTAVHDGGFGQSNDASVIFFDNGRWLFSPRLDMYGRKLSEGSLVNTNRRSYNVFNQVIRPLGLVINNLNSDS